MSYDVGVSEVRIECSAEIRIRSPSESKSFKRQRVAYLDCHCFSTAAVEHWTPLMIFPAYYLK